MLGIGSTSHSVPAESIGAVLLRKTNNPPPRSEMLGELIKVANTSLGLSEAQAISLFVFDQRIEESEASKKVFNELSHVLVSVSNEAIRAKVTSWADGCRPAGVDVPLTERSSTLGLELESIPQAVKKLSFITEKNARDRAPTTYAVSHDVQLGLGGKRATINVSVATLEGEKVASGCCVSLALTDGECLYIDSVNVKGHSNAPTRLQPNPRTGLGRLVVYEMLKLGRDHGFEVAALVPVEGTEGFYLKLGFVPKVSGPVNRMSAFQQNLTFKFSQLDSGKLDPEWVNRFEQASFSNLDYRRPLFWKRNVSGMVAELEKKVSAHWEIK